MELFDTAGVKEKLQPLAQRIRPTSINKFLGNKNIISNVLNTKNVSLIFWGAPGVGKTTLAKILATYFNADFYCESAISASVADVRKIISKGEYNFTHLGKKTVLFIDELHHFNKSQQDVLLKSIEEGKILFIGATTENPSFKVNNALLSRCQVYLFQSLADNDLTELLRRALEEDDHYKKLNLRLDDEARDLLVHIASGDGRILLNVFESAVGLSKDGIVTKEHVKDAYQSRTIAFDTKGEYHYDTISAFIKSVRGSDPDAALYYLAIMIEGGEDIMFIARRLVILASEDVGNANPFGLTMATACLTACQNIGMPEGRIILAQTTTYLASSPKSNASYNAINKAIAEIKKNGPKSIPMHMRNAPTKLMKGLGYSKGYKYPHSYDNHFVKECYLPEDVDVKFYQPTEIGYEKNLKKYLNQLWGDRF